MSIDQADEVVTTGAARARSSAGWSSYRLGVVALVVLTGLWRLVSMAQWSWWMDDWSFVGRTSRMPFWDYITQVYNGHVQPGQFAIVWAITKISPLNYAWAIAAVWLMSMASLVIWAILFRSLFGERWAALIGLIPVALAPGFVPIVVWTAAGLTTYALQLFMGLTLLCSLAWIRRGRRTSLLTTALSFVVGLVFWEKGLLTAIPVLGLALLLARTTTGRVAWRRVLTLAAVLGAISAVYVVLYLHTVRGDASDTSPSWVTREVGEVLRFYWAFLSQGLLPALTGGPWPAASQSNAGLLLPTTAAQWMVIALAIGLTVWGLSRRRHGWIPVVTALGYGAVSMGLVIMSTRYEFSGVFAAYDFRYVADSLVVFALMGTLLLVPAVGERDALRPRGVVHAKLPVWVGPSVALALLVLALGTSSATWDGFAPRSPKPWVDNVLADTTAAGSAAVLDANARPDVINGYLSGTDARLSSMLQPLGLPARWNGSDPTVLVAAQDGHLRPGVVAPAITSLPGPVPECGYLLQPGETQVVPMNAPIFAWEWGMQVQYFSRQGGTIRVRADSTVVTMTLAPGVASAQVVLEDGVRQLTISSAASSGPICIDKVIVGALTASVPAPSAPAAPAAQG